MSTDKPKSFTVPDPEGELKKRIRSLPDGKYMNVDAAFIRVGHVDTILDEAAKEFPIKGYRMEPQFLPKLSPRGEDFQETQRIEFDRPTPEEFLKLLQWFTRWFGESK